jgi:hypothetical protein
VPEQRLSFRTAPAKPKPVVTGFTVAGHVGSATLSWALPAFGDLHDVEVREAVGLTPPVSATAGTLVYDGTQTSATAASLTPGTDYAFAVFAHAQDATWSAATTAVLRGTRTTVTAKPSPSTYHVSTAVTATVRHTDGTPVVGQPVAVYWRRAGTTNAWAHLGTSTTDPSGQVTVNGVPSASVQLYATFAGAGGLGGSTVLGSDAVRFAVTAHPSATSVPLGHAVTLSGSVAAARPGQQVVVERFVSGAWREVAKGTLSASSTYAVAVTPSTRGAWTFRVVKPGDAILAVGISPTVSVAVT